MRDCFSISINYLDGQEQILNALDYEITKYKIIIATEKYNGMDEFFAHTIEYDLLLVVSITKKEGNRKEVIIYDK